jgi:hypothetical protein
VNGQSESGAVPSVYFDENRHLVVDHGLDRANWGEAVCCECGEPIQWVLNMMSFKYEHGRYLAGHARCLWMPEAFDSPLHRPARHGRPRPENEVVE